MKKRLPDFNTSKTWSLIHDKMGIEELIEIPKIDIDAISYQEIQALRTSSLDINNIMDHVSPIDGTFEYKGQKVLLYIKEQHYDMVHFDGNLTYKYHLAYCSTLNHMEKRGRFEKRYVVTQRVDQKFIVDIIDKLTGKFHDENKLCKMDVCKNCLSKLSKQYITDNLFYYDKFQLKDFIQRYNTQHSKIPPYRPASLPKNQYADNWSTISKEKRIANDYKCENCGKDLSKRKRDLHVHHVDGMKYNNNDDNLRVLCIKCHSKEPGHGKLRYRY